MSGRAKIIIYVLLVANAILFGVSALHYKFNLGQNGALCFGCVVIFGVLLALDVANVVGQQAMDFVFDDDAEGVKNPEYEEIEEMWKSGDYLESIRMLREYYKKFPREVHALMRVAEIYEKNLGNLLAAVLEYEELLKLKLPAERWGWAAIHLCNLYNKQNQVEKANTLLFRIAEEYSQTAAARKARERLGIPEPITAVAPAPVAAPAPAEAEPVADAGPKLPPGFRPK